MSCEQCIKESWIDHRHTRFALPNPKVYISASEDAMQNDLMPE